MWQRVRVQKCYPLYSWARGIISKPKECSISCLVQIIIIIEKKQAGYIHIRGTGSGEFLLQFDWNGVVDECYWGWIRRLIASALWNHYLLNILQRLLRACSVSSSRDTLETALAPSSGQMRQRPSCRWWHLALKKKNRLTRCILLSFSEPNPVHLTVMVQ